MRLRNPFYFLSSQYHFFHYFLLSSLSVFKSSSSWPRKPSGHTSKSILSFNGIFSTLCFASEPLSLTEKKLILISSGFIAFFRAAIRIPSNTCSLWVSTITWTPDNAIIAKKYPIYDCPMQIYLWILHQKNATTLCQQASQHNWKSTLTLSPYQNQEYSTNIFYFAHIHRSYPPL